MSIGKIRQVQDKTGYSQLMYIDSCGDIKGLLLTPRELSVCQDRASKNSEVMNQPTLMDRFFSFLLRLFSK